MGDRRMAEIVTEGGSLYVYSHSGGYMMAAKAEDAIKAAQPRWGDPSYETRIVVDQLIKGGRDSELGYGLMLKPNAEDEYNHGNPSIVIDLQKQMLVVVGMFDVTSQRTFAEIVGDNDGS